MFSIGFLLKENMDQSLVILFGVNYFLFIRVITKYWVFYGKNDSRFLLKKSSFFASNLCASDQIVVFDPLVPHFLLLLIPTKFFSLF